MSAYVIANYTVHDQEKYEKYPPAVMSTIQQYGGKLLVAEHDAKAKGCPDQVPASRTSWRSITRLKAQVPSRALSQELQELSISKNF